MTGLPGKWPWKKGSFTLTFLRPTTFEPTTIGPGRHLEDAVDEEERVAVRQEPQDLEDVGLRARFAHESPPLRSPAFSARRRTRRAVSGSRLNSIQDFW